jgi:predicted ATP-dependent endonuclease of OLD family
MKVKKFRIRNYKSIIDSGDCYLEPDLTIFAGKNESGKTSILEALENFNTDAAIPSSAKPISQNEILPKIVITLVLTSDELNQYYKTIGVEKQVANELEVTITKSFPNLYVVDPNSEKLLHLSDHAMVAKEKDIVKKIDAFNKEIQSVHTLHLARYGWACFNLNLENIDGSINSVNNYYTAYRNTYTNHIPSQTVRDAQSINLQNLIQFLKEYKSIGNSNDNWDSFFDILPNFILFKSFEDIIPNEIPYSELEKNEFIKDLSIISTIDTALIKSSDTRQKLQHQKDINIRFNKEYSKFWLQDLTEIKIHWDNNILYFWIEEDNTPFKPSERSKGKQWHMSFYIKITARALEEKTNIILVDEPGLYLHATAQNDIYKKLIDRSKRSQIMFTTHSPYLINKDELHRVRLVIKNNLIKEGSKIENKLHAKADKETLTPILTAIGLGLNDGIQNINQEKNIVVEGPSDYFYLQGLKKILRVDSFNFIFGGGAGNMGNIGAILSGWGCNVVYLFDNDQGLKNGRKNLAKTWFVKKDLIHAVKKDGGSIEDVFTKKDFQNHILCDSKAVIDISNSGHLKKHAMDKVLLARQFNSLDLNKIKFENETILIAQELFKQLEESFSAFKA